MKRLLAALTVRTKLFVLISACVLGFSAFGWLAFTTLSLVKVNGPYYQRIAQSKDLIADILPPPEYIIESYLVAMQMADTEDAAQLTALAEKSQTLRKDFETRHTFWLQELSADALRETLVVTAYQPAVDFFNLWEQAFLPALRRGDRAQARTVLREAMAPKYEEHRAAIDTVVTMATQRNKEDEQAAADIIAQVTRVLIACGVGAVVFLVCCGWSIARAITKPL
ncbi:MAG: methyl-accepting chemotaxis protein, partial [Candidatus Tectomicrobia bacterium]|nr:methyl-accepting chemotaxis protein [Candidatus Tectomicrobia bacterium]